VLEVVEEDGALFDYVAPDKERAIATQYRVQPGDYNINVLGREFKINARSGTYSTIVVFDDGQTQPTVHPTTNLPVAAFTAPAFQQSVVSLEKGPGGAEFLDPKVFGGKTLEVRLAGYGVRPAPKGPSSPTPAPKPTPDPNAPSGTK
jgi:hypothetical protein